MNVKPLIGSAATEINAIARMKDANIIHIATHGILDYSGLLASLAFTKKLGLKPRPPLR